jgi:thioredoxin-like negative regulator of GroEL
MSLFGKNTMVIQLTPENFKGKTVVHSVLDGKTSGMIMFGASWCRYCKEASPAYSKTAAALGSAFPLFYLDCEKYGEFAGKNLGVKGYPTFNYINKAGKMNKKYEGERTYLGFTKEICSESGICK